MKEPFRIGDRPTLGRIFGLLLLPAIVGAVLGALIGGLIGQFAPGVYATWFEHVHYPVVVGAILGASQLGLVGILVGAFVVVIVIVKAQR